MGVKLTPTPRLGLMHFNNRYFNQKQQKQVNIDFALSRSSPFDI